MRSSFEKRHLRQRLVTLPEALEWKLSSKDKVAWVRVTPALQGEVEGLLSLMHYVFENRKLEGSVDRVFIVSWDSLNDSSFITTGEQNIFDRFHPIVKAVFQIAGPTQFMSRLTFTLTNDAGTIVKVIPKSDELMVSSLRELPAYHDFSRSGSSLLKISPLTVAVMMGHMEATRHLVERRRVELNQLIDGTTTLHRAALMGHVEIVKYLVEKGAKTDIQDEDHETPLFKILSWKTLSSEKKLHLAKLLANDVSCNIDKHDVYPIDVAINAGDVDLVKTLIEQGAIIPSRPRVLWSPTNSKRPFIFFNGREDKTVEHKSESSDNNWCEISRLINSAQSYYTNRGWVTFFKISFDDIPSKFICSISHEIMNTPVFDNRSPQIFFDRSYILEWLKGDAKHPITRAPLAEENLCESMVLKEEITQFLGAYINKAKPAFISVPS